VIPIGDLADMEPRLGPMIASPNSNHTGGVNCVFVDGAVRFIPDGVDFQPSGTTSEGLPDPDWQPGDPAVPTPPIIPLPPGTTRQRQWSDWRLVPTGQSLYGVWGALGTPSGRETKMLE